MMTTQSSEGSPIDAATKRNSTLFAAYIVVLLVTALIIAVFTWLTWDSGNKVQDAIRKDADARIAQAGQQSSQANALAQAARADAETARVEQEKLKKESLQLAIRLQEMEATNTVAQQKIQKLEEGNKPRVITKEQVDKVVSLLKPFAGQELSMRVYGTGNEITIFSGSVSGIFAAAGLKVNNSVMMASGVAVTGLGIVVHDLQSQPPPLADAILLAFRSASIPIAGIADSGVVTTPGQFVIVIGEKPKSN